MTGGLFFVKWKEYDKAFADFDQATRPRPKISPRLLRQRRYLATPKSKPYDKAVAAYSTAITIDPNDVRALVNRGYVCWLDQKEYTKAIADFDAAPFNLDAHCTVAIYNRGDAWLNTKEYDKAIADFQSGDTPRPQYLPLPSATGDMLGSSKGIRQGFSRLG